MDMSPGMNSLHRSLDTPKTIDEIQMHKMLKDKHGEMQQQDKPQGMNMLMQAMMGGMQ